MTMEDPDEFEMELEVDNKLLAKQNRMRKRIMNIYNKRAEDFETKLEFDDFLEEREDIVFNLCENIDVESTEARVKAYEAANSASIAANMARKAGEEKAKAAAADAELRQEDEEMADAAPAKPETFVPTLAPGQLPPPPGLVPNQLKRKVPETPTAAELRAGGWDPDLPKIRAIHDAFTSLVFAA